MKKPTPNQAAPPVLSCIARWALAIGILPTAGLGAATTNEPASPPPQGSMELLSEIIDAASDGRYWIEARYRFAYIAQGGKKAEALASTLRTVFGYETSVWNDFQAGIEFENVTAIGNDVYNSTQNGHLYAPIEADPEGTEVNQAYMDYLGTDLTTFRMGRQRIRLDNQRFVGSISWRQNEQTFDAFTMSSTRMDRWKLFYGYINNVNQVFGTNADMSSHLFNASYELETWGNLAGYLYALDYDHMSVLDTTTIGIRWTDESDVRGDFKLAWTLEAATQSDYADNPNSIGANYYHGELAATMTDAPAGLGIRGGYEVLEGNSAKTGDMFSTPLATSHAFNGWADVFLTTPDTGLMDYYFAVNGTLNKAKWAVIYHMFEPQDGSMDYGTELDAVISYPCSSRVQVGLKGAFYYSDGFASNRDKIWFWLSIRP